MPIVIPAPSSPIRLTIATGKNLRIVFFGTPQFAVPALRALVRDGWPIAAVVTAPDAPVGRRQSLTSSAIKTAALELGLPVLAPATLKEDDLFTSFSELRPDLCIVVAYGKLIPERYLKLPRLGFLNIHPSLLPAYRGPSPIQSAILDGCAGTGVSLMVLDSEMDHGPILAQEAWHIPAGADAALCEDELSRVGAQLLIHTILDYVRGILVPRPQDHTQATFTKKFQRSDGRLDWTQPAHRINDRIRALGSDPGTWTTWEQKTFNISAAHMVPDVQSLRPPGTVFLHEGALMVACGSGTLAIDTLQLEGSTRQNTRDFLNGHRTLVGAQLS